MSAPHFLSLSGGLPPTAGLCMPCNAIKKWGTVQVTCRCEKWLALGWLAQ